MAETAVRSVVKFVGRLLIDEAQFLYGVEGKLEELRDELVWMQCFLKSADDIQYEDEIVALWVSQIKQNVMAAEDIIEKFVIHVMSRRRGNGWALKLKRYSLVICELIDLHKAGSRIDSFRRKISTLTPRLQTYVLKTNYIAKVHLRGKARITGAPRRHTYPYDRLNRDAQQIVNHLLCPLRQTGSRTTIIRGKRGLGKRTVAHLVFHHKDTRLHYCGFAWLNISGYFHLESVLQQLVSSLTLQSANMDAQMTEAQLIDEVYQLLNKNRYLVVLDGVQDEESWDRLSAAFSLHGASTSDVILTTCNLDIDKPFYRGDEVKLLSVMETKESWEFLQMNLGFRQENFGNDGTEVKKLGEEMAKHCNGVPLVVIVLSGMLQNRATLKEWQDVNENLASFFRSRTDRSRSYMDVLFSGYNDLPYHLKTCFLHLATFPENYEIPLSKIYRMWVAEGLLALDGFSEGTSLWDVANSYLNEMDQLGMVETMKKGSDGRIRSFRIHNLLKEVCLHKAVAENFLNLIDYRGRPTHPRITRTFSSHKRLLRAAVYLAPDIKNILPDSLNSEAKNVLPDSLNSEAKNILPDSPNSEAESILPDSPNLEAKNILPDSLYSEAKRYLRSLSIFSGDKADQDKIQDKVQSICKDFRHLRLLDIEGLHLQGKLTRDVRNLVHLRYLSLKDTKVSELPSSIANLIFLQVLDLRVLPSVSCFKIPNTLYKLEQLMHLLLPSVTYEVIKSEFLRLHTLSDLEILANLDVSKFQLGDLLNLCKLRKLTVKDIITGVKFLNLISQLTQSHDNVTGKLFTCCLRLEGSLLSRKPSTLSGLGCLRRLNIEGKVSVPDQVEIGFPPFLKSLRLVSCKLTSDPMRILGRLEHLQQLFMEQNSYVGEVMECDNDGFAELRSLHLQGLLNLRVLKGTYGKKLRRVVIKNCAKLKLVPDFSGEIELTCSPCFSWIRACCTCICYKRTLSGIAEHDVHIHGGFQNLPDLLVHEDNKIVILWGEGGVGKSTLAKKPYNDPKVNMYFDATAWVSYPRTATCSPSRQMLQRLLKDLAPEKSKEELSWKSLNGLIIELQEIMQQKKCFVVFTDLLNSDLIHLRAILGDQVFKAGSKLLLTMNEKPENLAYFEVTSISFPDGLNLLNRRLGRSVEVIDTEVRKKMVLCCSRHPLPIILLAGLLSINASATRAATIKERLESAVNASTDRVRTIDGKLRSARIKLPVSEVTSLMYALSYDDLQPHMIRCFLYLANFPEGAEISTRKLYQMWSGARFLQPREVPFYNYEMLNEANVYLKELVERGMVQAVKRGSSTRISKCRLHVTLHSLCLAKAKEEKLLTIINCQHDLAASASGDISGSVLKQVVVHFNQGDDVVLPAPSSLDNDVDSLLFFPNVNNPEHREEDWEWFMKICNRFHNLLILDLEGMWMTRGTLPKQIESLSCLRYLSLKDTFVSELPQSIGKLQYLETLDLRVMESIIIPDVLGEFLWLCHLYLPKAFHIKSEKLSLNESAYLLTLVNFSTNKVHLNGASPYSLQKISINEIRKGDDYGYLFESLLSPSVEVTINAEVINEDPSVLSSLRNLTEVRIKGSISDTVRLQAQMFPECLKELTLKDTQLKDDPIPVLENLPALTSLCLDRNSFLGKKMTFSSGGFKRLTHLMFRSLRNLDELDLTEAPDRVRKLDLVILDCWRLQYIREAKEDIDEAVSADQCVEAVSLLRRWKDTFCYK